MNADLKRKLEELAFELLTSQSEGGAKFDDDLKAKSKEEQEVMDIFDALMELFWFPNDFNFNKGCITLEVSVDDCYNDDDFGASQKEILLELMRQVPGVEKIEYEDGVEVHLAKKYVKCFPDLSVEDEEE